MKAYTIPLPGKVAWFYWVIYFTNMGLIQGPMTIALHCTELVVNIIRNENMWRWGTKKKGAKMTTNLLESVVGSWLNGILLCAKALLREHIFSVMMVHVC